MTVLRVILADQLSSQLDIVAGAEKGKDVFLLAEVMSEATYVRHHVKKIAFLFSAMRHFAEDLRSAGHGVRYVGLDDVCSRPSRAAGQAHLRHQDGPGDAGRPERGSFPCPRRPA